MTLLARATAAAALSMMTIAPAARADTVKIGLIASFTGGMAIYGSQFQQAIAAYQALHGATLKGPKGEPITVEIVTRDAGSGGPAKVKQMAEELVVRDHVKFLAGFDLSPHAMAAADIANEAKVPVIIMNAATSSITRLSPYFVRLSFTVPQNVKPLAGWAYKQGMRKVFTVVSDFAPGYDAESYFAKSFKEQGGDIIGAVRTPLSEMNFAVYLEKVLEAKPDALFMFEPGGASAIAFLKAYNERGLKAAGIKLMGTGETEAIYLKDFNDDVIGTITAFPYTESNTRPQNTALKQQLAKMFGPGAGPDVASAGAWDGMDLIYKALAARGANASGDQYVEVMKGQKIESPRGPIMIDPETRDIVQNVYIRRVERQNGELTNVDIDTAPMVKDPWKIDNPPKGN